MVLPPDLTPSRPSVAARHGDGHRRPRRARRGVRERRAAAPSCSRQVGPACRAWPDRTGGTELEFIVFDDTLPRGLGEGLPDLTPAVRLQHRLPICASSRGAAAARHPQRHGRGRHVLRGLEGRVQPRPAEIAFRYAEAIATCDNHTIYKNGAKEIADQHGKALTFMAKFDEREGNSCHIHLSVRAEDGTRVRRRRRRHRMLALIEHAVAGVLESMRELTLLFAPNINSYKRSARGCFAPTGIAWGIDNRTCAVRVVGDGRSMRIENRFPAETSTRTSVSPRSSPPVSMASIASCRLRGALRRQRLRRRRRALAWHLA